MGRATGLLVVAVLIGLALLHRGSGGGSFVSAGRTTTSNVTSGSTDTTRQPTTGTTRPNSSNTTTTQPLRAKADIKVLVANGTNSPGLASTVSTTLRGKGYNTLASINSTLKVANTAVYFEPGYDADAGAMATVLGLPGGSAKPLPATLPVPSLNGANILVVAGPELGSSATTATTGNSRTTSTTGHTSTT